MGVAIEKGSAQKATMSSPMYLSTTPLLPRIRPVTAKK